MAAHGEVLPHPGQRLRKVRGLNHTVLIHMEGKGMMIQVLFAIEILLQDSIQNLFVMSLLRWSCCC